MVAGSLEEKQREMAERLTRDILAQISAQEALSLREAWQTWQVAHGNLVLILRRLDPEFSDACQKEGRPLETATDDYLARHIIMRLQLLESEPGNKQVVPPWVAGPPPKAIGSPHQEEMPGGQVPVPGISQGEETPPEAEGSPLLPAITPGEATLTTRAVEVLTAAGYRVRGLGRELRTRGGEGVWVDILAEEAGNGDSLVITLLGEGAPQEDPERNWLRLRQVSSGKLYVICDTLARQRAAQNEINLQLQGKPFISFLTNLESLESGKRAADGGIWLSGRQTRCLERLPY